MEDDPKELKDAFIVKFGGASEMDAQLLASNILFTAGLVQDLNKVMDPDRKITVKVKATRESSFLIEFENVETILEVVKNIFATNNVSYVANLTASLLGVYALLEKIRTVFIKKATVKGDIVTVVTGDGNTYEIDRQTYELIKNNPELFATLQKQFSSLAKSDDIESFEVSHPKTGRTVKFDRNRIESVGRGAPAYEIEKRLDTTRETLRIIGLSFESFKWKFLSHGHKISATITDQSFIRRIEDREPFAKGDYLVVDLIRNQEFDNEIKDYVNTGVYSIPKVHEHQRPDVQLQIGSGVD
jgi:hypothetical protein